MAWKFKDVKEWCEHFALAGIITVGVLSARDSLSNLSAPSTTTLEGRVVSHRFEEGECANDDHHYSIQTKGGTIKVHTRDYSSPSNEEWAEKLSNALRKGYDVKVTLPFSANPYSTEWNINPESKIEINGKKF